MFEVTFKIRGRAKRFAGNSLASVQDQWRLNRDASGVGSSAVMGGDVTKDGATICRMSYNGRVWVIGGDFVEYVA